jgi:hypothetical protein
MDLDRARGVLAQAQKARERFLEALAHPRQAQERILRACIEPNAGTSFGLEHGFSAISTAAELRSAVPIRRYLELAPYVERAAAGERAVLTAEPPLVFLQSSGTTGASKKIPATASFFQGCFLPTYFASLSMLLEQCPEAITRPDATLNLKWDPNAPTGSVASGAGHVGASQLDFARMGQRMAREPGCEAPWADIPSDITDYEERAYYRLRLAIESDVRLVIGINPAMVHALHDQLARDWERLLVELRRGTVADHTKAAPNHARADELERAASQAGDVSPALVWPRLSSVLCWTSGVGRLYLPWLARRFGPSVRLLSAPSGSSEGPVGLPIDPTPFEGGPLAVHTAYYEFVEAEKPLGPESEAREFHQLEAGGLYHVVITQCGGLYRYAVGDVVRVTGFVGEVPKVDYVGRDPHPRAPLLPLAEWEAIDAVLAASHRALGPDSVRSFALAPASAPGESVRAVVELRSSLSDDRARLLEDALEAALATASASYRSRRAERALGPVRLHLVSAGTFSAHQRARVRAGIRPTQVKDRPLLAGEKDLDALLVFAVEHGARPGGYS